MFVYAHDKGCGKKTFHESAIAVETVPNHLYANMNNRLLVTLRTNQVDLRMEVAGMGYLQLQETTSSIKTNFGQIRIILHTELC